MIRRKRRVRGGVLKKPRVYVAAALPVAIPLLLAAFTTQPSAAPTVTAAITTPELRYEELSVPSPAELPEHSIVLTFEKADTIDAVMTAGGVSRADSARLTNEFARFIDMRRLRPGHLLRFHRTRDGEVDAVQMKVTGWGDIEAIRGENGTFSVRARQADLRSESTVISATIDTSLYDAIRSTGESPQLVSQLVDVFQWDVDFFALQKGDSFSLVVEKRYAGNDMIGYGPVLAARFTHNGNNYEAFRHEMSDGRSGYYARNASPLRKQFLRAPLQFTRITSGFSKKRFHPVLNYFRPHYGVDYGAPTGTPVMTTADGVIVSIGRKGGEGNVVTVRHTSRIETSYLHLSRFAKGLKRGARVTQGDVIGYVGMTGLATGPHLDYRVKEAGRWIDPLKLKSITPDPLRGDSLRRFRSDVASLGPRLSYAAEQPVSVASTSQRALF
jgi:murein DD-endopeptidase MepM/ murein hydrolase activator NlpD